ncbi:conserved hypothetical protein [Ricinus communis]|uniref:Replication-associated protein ORF2/G2P domain-containing protein n=1 Tax=Ricinus communis TaxID=3988 RepID=B9TBL6_RICCO|nr:conserved hypothetical protein [Ricinus communis]
MQHKPDGFIDTAVAEELTARMRASAPAGQVRGEVEHTVTVLPPPVDLAGGAAAYRLEKRTHLDEGSYRIKLTNYGNGLGEVGWSFIPAKKPIKVGKGMSDNRDENEDRSVRRARSRLRKLILSSQADHLLTLTYRENMTDFEQASADLNKFVRIVKSKLPGWIYIAVAEQQKRGAWHWHMAVRGRQDVELLRESWRHVVGEGNIDVNPPKGKGKDRLLGLVKYLGKYLAKGFQEGNRELNARRFRASLGISIPCTVLPLPTDQRSNASGYAVEMLKANVGEVGYVWLAEDRPAGWACSWK